jgi:N utilization substance protein B
MRTPRRRAREFALQGLYQWQLSGASPDEIERHLAQAAGFGKADGALFSELLRGTIADSGALTATFAPFLDRESSTLSPVERGVLLLAAHELRDHPHTPYRVILNEAIELAKAYGATDGHKYVNAVLDRIAAVLRPAEIAAASGARDPRGTGRGNR